MTRPSGAPGDEVPVRGLSVRGVPVRELSIHAVAALWLAFTLYETLHPVGWGLHVPFWSFFTQTMAGVDTVQNVVLFAPAGWLAHRAGWTAWRSILAAFVLSAAIEFAQQWIPGRLSTAVDIACNTSGAALGWWMATRATRPRVRLALAFATLAACLTLHLLNTEWPEPATAVDGAGVWRQVTREACTGTARASTVCLTVPNTAAAGNKYFRISGPLEHTYVRAQSVAEGRLMGRGDCVALLFESTVTSPMRLRPPLTQACVLVDTSDRVVALQVDPRLEHEVAGAWTATRVGAWIWPLWPFEAYQPAVLRAAGAFAFIALAALFAGSASWLLPAGYLAMLELLAFVAGMRAPGLWDLGWGGVAWLVGVLLLRVDRWWRQSAPRPNPGVSAGRADDN